MATSSRIGLQLLFLFGFLYLFFSVAYAQQEVVSDTLVVTVLGDIQCIDGIDNDSDGYIDFPNDPGCGSYDDDDEYNAPITQCADGLDNDSDGFIDYPDDTGCDSVDDDNEYVYAPPSGGGGGGGGGGSSPDKTSVVFLGITHPNAELLLLKSGQIVESEIADSDGDFDIRLSDISEGQYNFMLQAVDGFGLNSFSPAFNVEVKEDVTTSVSSIYLPPTIRLDKAQVKNGNMLTVDGFTFSSSTVLVYIDTSDEAFDSTFSNSNGYWKYELESEVLGYGDHTIRSKTLEKSFESTFSSALPFKVGLHDVLKEVTESCGSIADLNYDCRVNLIDFSMAVFWYKKNNPPPKIDIIADGVVDIRDFSVMASYWTG